MAREIAVKSECKDRLDEIEMCNIDTGTWWISLDVKKEGCNPACVVFEESSEVEINWRCTGALPPKE